MDNFKGNVKDELEHEKGGMVIDFSDLKNIVKENIIKKFDH